MEFTKRVGRTTFRADVTHDERGDWVIKSGAYQAALPLTWPEVDQWEAAGKPSDPTELPERVTAFLGKLAGGKPSGTPAKRVKYERRSFATLDGEERVVVGQVERMGAARDGAVMSGVVHCYSPRHDDGKALWFVIARPGSTYDRTPKYCDGAGRVENMTPDKFAEQHRAWHQEQFGVSQRVELDRWIERNAHVAPPELTEDERREIDLGIAIAKSER